MAMVILDTGRTNNSYNYVHTYDLAGNDFNTYDYSLGTGHVDIVRQAAEEYYKGQYIHVKITPDGSTHTQSTQTISDALQWVINNKYTYNIEVVNISFGSNRGTASEVSPHDSLLKILDDMDVAVFQSAGNNGRSISPSDVSLIAKSKYSLAVSATTPDNNTLADYSDRHVENTDISFNGSIYYKGTDYYQGTSFASPRLAGAYHKMSDALKQSRGFGLDRHEFEVALDYTSNKVQAPVWVHYPDPARLESEQKDFNVFNYDATFNFLVNTETLNTGSANAYYINTPTDSYKTLNLKDSIPSILVLVDENITVKADERVDNSLFFNFSKDVTNNYITNLILEGTKNDWSVTSKMNLIDVYTHNTYNYSIEVVGVDNIHYMQGLIS